MLKYAVLTLGVVSVSWSAIFIRLADAPSVVIACARMVLATAFLIPFFVYEMLKVRPVANTVEPARHQTLLIVASGVFLGLHMFAWISSLEYTTVAIAVVLVSTNPIFVGLGSHFILKERVGAGLWAGIAVAISGSLVIGLSAFDPESFDWTGGHLAGAGLALLGAAFGSAYFLIGRRIRQSVSLVRYIFLVYGVAGALLLLVTVAGDRPLTGYSPQTLLMFVLLALIPTILGHSSFNWSLKYISPSVVSVVVLGEPVLATILAVYVLNEVPALPEAIGAGIILIGIYICMKYRT